MHAASASAALLVGALTLAPVWTPPILATNDGPSHAYNAALADGVRAGRAPFATLFRSEHGLRPNMASHWLLLLLGPRLGWGAAERLLVTVAMAATFAVLLAVVAGSGPHPPLVVLLLAPLAGWLTSSWFVWGGAYDFALSIPFFIGLLIVLRRPPSLRGHVVLQLLLALLYLTHLFTFAAGIALVVAAVGWPALVGSGSGERTPWRRLGIAIPALGLLAVEMMSGGPGTGAVLWGDRWDALRGLCIGDFAVSVSPLDVVGGATIMAAAWTVVAFRWRAALRAGLSAVSGVEVFGVALLALSLVAPHGVGEGTYIPIRMRYLGVLALLPAIAGAAAAIRPARVAVPAMALLAAFAVHAVVLDRDARRVHRDVVLIDRLLTAAGAREESWVVTRLTTYRRGLFHVAGYRHIVGRVAVPRRMVVLDNYEALYGVFSTVWRATPDWIRLRPATGGLTARLAPGEIRWQGGVFVLHERDQVIRAADPRLAVGPSARDGAFAVTLVRRLDPPPRDAVGGGEQRDS